MIDTPPSLLQRLREMPSDGDWKRFDDLYRPFLGRVLLKTGIQAADVEDLVNDVLTIWLAKLKSFDRKGPGSLRAWLRKVAINRFKDLACKKKPWRVQADLEAVFEQLADPHSELSRFWDEQHDRHVLQDALGRIEHEFSPHVWKAFLRFAIEGSPAKEVAQEIGISISAVFVAKHRIMKRLKEEIEGMVESS